MFEHRRQPLLSHLQFFLRLARSSLIAGGIILGWWGIGTVGYHWAEGLDWIDSIANAAMILSGMGPLGGLQTTAGKLFASLYAVASGVVFLTVAAVLFAPVFHRLIHRFHLDYEDDSL